jgi:ABC-2 type transport system permease protein
MNMVWAVIRREYIQRVRSKWFIFSTIAGPLFMIAVMVLPIYFANKSQQAGRKIAVVDRTGVLAERLLPALREGGFDVETQAWSDTVVPHLTQQVSDKALGGFLVLDDQTLKSGEAVYYGESRPSTLRSLTMRQAIVAAALEQQLLGQGVDAAAMVKGGKLDVQVLSAQGDVTDKEMAVGFAGAFFLYVVILLYSVAVMRATLEEKTSRVVEVVISSMKPWHLMLGKILGVGSVGLTQMAVWALSAGLIFSMGLPAMISARPELAQLADLKTLAPGAGLLVLFVAFFLFGFFLFSSMYAAVGAMCSTDEEAQQAQFPVTLLIIVPIMFMTPVMNDPTSAMAVGMSLFPFFSPILMFARAAGGAAPAWQVGLSFVLMAVTIVAVAWVAGRIYKVGILMAGKRPTLPELVRWVREA